MKKNYLIIMKQLSAILMLVLIFFSPSILSAQGKTIKINIESQRYVPPGRTPKIPQEFKDHGARFAVRAGDVINICNADKFFAKPFSLSKENKFQGIGGSGGLRPGSCITIKAQNPGNKPISFWLHNEVHVPTKLFMVVLPANWPNEGEESTPPPDTLYHPENDYWMTEGGEIIFDANHKEEKVSIPKSMRECEGGYCATWTLQGNKFKALWDNGAQAIITIEKFDDNHQVILIRHDTGASVSKNFSAKYTGTISDAGNNIIDGTVTFTQDGRSWYGKWSASW